MNYKFIQVKIIFFLFAVIIAKAQTSNGLASYYANKFEGRRCSSGEIFRHDKLTCAHKTLPFGTMLKVCNSKNKCVTVKVNDRLPKHSKRSVDLTLRAAREIDLYYAGVMKVTIEVIGKDSIIVEKQAKNMKTLKQGK